MSAHSETSNAGRGRILVLLAVYALFMVLPGLHLLVHDHGGAAPAVTSSGVAYLDHACSSCCGDGHDDHAHGSCAVCDVIDSINVTPGDLPAGPSVAAVATLLSALRADAPRSGAVLRPTARGPPATFAS